MEPLSFDRQDSFDVLFDLFGEDDLCQDDIGVTVEEIDNGDETSSESSGSSGGSGSSSASTSPPFEQLSTYYPSPIPPKVSFASNPHSSFKSEVTETSNKRTKTEEKLMRNRLSANKSRLKRKNERLELEETVATLRERVRVLEMENAVLLTDNTTLTQNNYFLQELLKKHQSDEVNREAHAPSKHISSRNQMSAISGISVLCVVFSVSFFSDWLPNSLMGTDDENSWNVASSSGRVLLSLDDDEGYVSLATTPKQSSITFQYLLILTGMFLYYFYIQYEASIKKKSANILPS
jgi:hypothetical protein